MTVLTIDAIVNTAYINAMKTISKLKRGDLRDALVDYTLDVARDGHIETMSLRKAARDLGVSSGAVYRHFADKGALLAAVAEEEEGAQEALMKLVRGQLKALAHAICENAAGSAGCSQTQSVPRSQT